jgi:transposase
MKDFIGMDLHSNNTYIGVLDEEGKKVFKTKLPNELERILAVLKPFDPFGIAVESTFNWYWLVDGLMESGYSVYLANPSAMKQYEGLKYVADFSEAFYLAELLRLGILPTGYIYPKEERGVRDLLRKRMMLVQQRTVHILSFESLFNRLTGKPIKSNVVKKLNEDEIESMFDIDRNNDSDSENENENEYYVLSAKANISMLKVLTEKIKEIEQVVLSIMKLKPEFQKLLTISGIGETLALTIALEAGDIRRFKGVGNYASYSRCVQSLKKSNGKKKGENNRKNGNKYLAWAYIEAANKARIHCPYAKRFFERKAAKTNNILATKALAHKISRLSYYVMKEQTDYDPRRAFGPLKVKVKVKVKVKAKAKAKD